MCVHLWAAAARSALRGRIFSRRARARVRCVWRLAHGERKNIKRQYCNEINPKPCGAITFGNDFMIPYKLAALVQLYGHHKLYDDVHLEDRVHHEVDHPQSADPCGQAKADLVGCDGGGE